MDSIFLYDISLVNSIYPYIYKTIHTYIHLCEDVSAQITSRTRYQFAERKNKSI